MERKYSVRKGLYAVIAATALLAVTASTALQAAEHDPLPEADPLGCGDRPIHLPITVDAEDPTRGFVIGHDPVSGSPIHRPGSGITGGSGTLEDPYVISGWCIIAEPTGQYGIEITSSNAHLVIRDNMIQGFPHGAILLDGTSHTTIEENELDENRGGVALVLESTVNSVRRNTIRSTHPYSYGINLWKSDENTVESNSIATQAGGLILDGASRNIVARNELDGSGHGLIARHAADENVIEGNWFLSHWRAVKLYQTSEENAFVSNQIKNAGAGGAFHVAGGSDGTKILDNQIVNSEGTGLWSRARSNVIEGNLVTGHADDGVWASAGSQVSRNLILDNGGTGLVIVSGFHVIVENNTITGNGHGVDLEQVTRSTITSNHIEDNGVGLRVKGFLQDVVLRGNNLASEGPGIDGTEMNGNLDARYNWWGCAGGPGKPECATVDGTVEYDPWLTDPNPSAGANP